MTPACTDFVCGPVVPHTKYVFMKPIISVVAIAGVFAFSACNRNEMKEKEAALQAQQHTIDSMNDELAKKRVIDSMNEVASSQYVIPQEVIPVASAVPAAAAPARRRSSSTRSRSTSSSSSNNNSVAQSQPAPVVEQRKKGWSAKAKGALIGAGVGAATGAAVNGRNRAAGAVIGGVSGAAVGTGVGAVIDKKKDR